MPAKKATKTTKPDLLDTLGHHRLGDKRNRYVRKAQLLLAQFGYYVKDDGILGTVTSQALAEFQEKVMIPVNGELDKRTWESLLTREV